MAELESQHQQSSGQRQIPIVCPGHTRPLAEVQFCAVIDDEKENKNRILLVSACHDKLPMMRDGSTGDWIGTFEGHKGAVWSCHVDPMANLAATASGDFSVRVWDAITGDCLFTLPHKHIVKTCDFSCDSTRLATGGHEGLLRIYDLTKLGKPDPKKNITETMLCLPQTAATDNKKIHISKCIWFDNSTVLAAASDGKIRFWDVSDNLPNPSNRLLKTISIDSGKEIRDMELTYVRNTKSSNEIGTPVITVAADSFVYFYALNETSKPDDTTTPLLLKKHRMPIHFRDEGGASLHPSGKIFIAGGSDLWIRVFDFETGKELECNKGHHGPIRCVRYAPGGDTYATGSEDGTIRLWKTFA
eukprot:CAMPEP_0172414790 /NCGR_PEP_ID=MMETSP1064-20121228/1410_1 /TAXON_ID=202472 /ORGANISM="Aulacoseira subarctica , Strain CCAP 1002/5" /LENGTH=358 /DNA_ID=CAMNT_0013151613 /DNA_START=35 /DNA_END=1111 /DNA_ORIENTATION=+